MLLPKDLVSKLVADGSQAFGCGFMIFNLPASLPLLALQSMAGIFSIRFNNIKRSEIREKDL